MPRLGPDRASLRPSVSLGPCPSHRAVPNSLCPTRCAQLVVKTDRTHLRYFSKIVTSTEASSMPRKACVAPPPR